MPKYNHTAEILDLIPQDYYERWDASNLYAGKGGVLWNDEDAREWSNWQGQRFGETAPGQFTRVSGTTYPIFTTDADGLPCSYADGGAGPREVTAALDALDQTVFVVWKMDDYDAMGTGYNSVLHFSNIRHGSYPTTDPDNALVRNNSNFTTEAFEGRRIITAHTVTHNATDDNDVAMYCGTTNIANNNTLPDANVSYGYWGIHCHGATTIERSASYVYEIIVWDRVLAAGELTDVNQYLSAKWKCAQSDTTSDTPYTSSTYSSWVTPYLDKEGKGKATNNSVTNHVVSKLPSTGGLTLAAGTNNPSDRPWSGFDNLVFWFDASQQNGMTFATGSAFTEGSTVSAWTDLTGSLTLDNSTFLTTDPPTLTKYKGKHWALQGGTGGGVGVAGLRHNAIVTSWNSLDKTHVFVGRHGETINNSGTYDTLYDMTALGNSCLLKTSGEAMFLGSSGQAWSWGPSRGPSADNDIFVFVTRIDRTTGGLERWYNGHKLPDTSRTPTLYANGGPTILCDTSSTKASNGWVFELGSFEDKLTDGEIESLTRTLCNKYDIDYMHKNTPLVIAANYANNSTLKSNMPYWFKCDDQYLTRNSSGDITSWSMHELVTEHARDVNTTDGDTPPTPLHGQVQHQAADFDGTSDWLKDLTAYDWTETTTFPARTGCSVFCVGKNNSKVTNGALWEGASLLRQSVTTGYLEFRYSATSLTGAVDENTNWVCVIGTYDETGAVRSAGDMTLDVNENQYTTNDATPTSPVWTYPSIGARAAGNEDNDATIREVAEYKFPLTDNAIANLQRYAVYWYGDEGNFGL